MHPNLTAAQTCTFEPTRAAGLERLARFVPHAGRSYASSRNTDYGPDRRGNVSTLSPYVRRRMVSEAEVLEATLERFSLSSAEKFVQEVFWRSYFKGHLETRPAIWARYRQALSQQVAALEGGGGLAKAYRQATEGRTGIDCFDAWVQELVETGYLHNHTRMWFASIWIFTLKLPWELGADFTFRHFIDGDPASNTLSWRWVGGLHTKGKTYLARRDNIVAHSDGRFDPKGLAREAPALEEEPVGAAHALPAADARWPAGRFGLLLTEDDLTPSALGGSGVTAVAGVLTGDLRSPLPVGELVTAFDAGAMTDAMQRTGETCAAPTSLLATLTATTLRDFARAHDVAVIATAYPPVGPVADALAEAEPVLARDAITLVRVRRHYDTACWPHATRGFFGLKERIPDLLAEIGVGAAADEAPAQAQMF